MNTKIVSLTTFILAQLFSLSGFAQTCEMALRPETKKPAQRISKFTKTLAQSLSEIKDWDNTYDTTVKPNWEKYQTLGTLVSKLEMRVEKEKKPLSNKEIEYLKNQLESWALPYHKIAKELSERELTESEIRFIDTNYAFFKLQQRVNELIGLEIFPDYYIKQVQSEPELIKQAVDTIAQLKKAQSKLFSTSGYATPAKLRSAIKKHSKEYADTLNFIDDQLVVAIHRPENARFWIPLTGFQNQRVTGSSKGSLNPDYRNQVESALTFQETLEYSQKSVRYMPNYGEARPEAGTTLHIPNKGADGYGSDLWIVKKSLYDSRASWTPRDSFGQFRAANFESAKSWDQMFIPWTSRELMVPYAMGEKRFGVQEGAFNPGLVKSDFSLEGNRSGSSYFEVQIWGPLSLNDIEAFHFKVNPPTREFYDLLVSKGIKVYDERTLPAQIYTP